MRGHLDNPTTGFRITAAKLVSRLKGGLQRTCPTAEARIELDRRLTGIADRALHLLEIARGEIVALLQVGAVCGSFPDWIGPECIELTPEAPGKLGNPPLA